MITTKSLKKKQVKEIKKEITNYGILERGYSWGIFDVLDKMDLIYIVIDLACDGLISPKDDTSNLNLILTEYVKRAGYQEFKKLLPYIF